MLGLLIGGLIFGGAAIAAGIDNAKMMKEPVRHLDDGTPVYIDRKCKQHINGEKVITQWRKDEYGNIRTAQVGVRSGRVYFDPDQAQTVRMRETYDKPNLERAKKEGKLACKLWHPEFKEMLSTEISTGKIIVCLTHDFDKDEYRKFYYGGGYQPCISNGCFRIPRVGDPGILITKDEYEKLYHRDGTYSMIR